MARSLERPRLKRAATGLLAALTTAAATAAVEPLTVCVAADNPPLAWQQGEATRGLEPRIAAALAERLGRPLRLLPFESGYEKESSLAQEVAALLSSGVCELASGFPLLAADLGPPARPVARTPDYPGAKRKRDRPWVPLQPLLASRAYQGTALGLVQPREAAPVQRLQELQAAPARRVGVLSGSLAGSALMAWQGGALRGQVVSLGQRDDPFAVLQSGRVDALLLPLPQWDAWRLAHADAPLAASPWRGALGLNLGFVAIPAQAPLLAALDALLAEARADGRLPRWAAEEGVSWLAPGQPEVRPGFSLAGLRLD